MILSRTESRPARFLYYLGALFIVLLLSSLLSVIDRAEVPWITLWPSLVALTVVFVFRSAWVGLLCGASAGALLLHGHPVAAIAGLFGDQLLPIFTSSWKLSAIAFTLILGGFVALVEASGGLQALIRRLLGQGSVPVKRMQLTVFGFGLLVFFDGLANTMLIGRMLRGAADRCGVSREKLAYLADTTGSAVACLAFISTWIAFQLAMIREGFAAVGMEVNAYALFFKSVPGNFYCWFALAMAVVCVLREFNPGSMAECERAARENVPADAGEDVGEVPSVGGWWNALLPILVLVLSIPLLSYLIGAESLWPFSLQKFAVAYAVAEAHVPVILVASGVVAVFCAGLSYRPSVDAPGRGRVFLSGVGDLLGPIGILICAWLLGGVIGQLGAADALSQLLSGQMPLAYLPSLIFLLGALISFSTGTSWGTMGVLMPLAIPVVFQLTGLEGDIVRDHLVVASIGAVFSGAVFGDHCSPFSDTTIISSIAAGVEPLDHVRTQFPFALLSALVALLCGFLPLGWGLPAWACLMLGFVALMLLPVFWNTNKHGTNRR